MKSRAFSKVIVILCLLGCGNSIPNNTEESRILYGVPGNTYFFPWSCWVNSNQFDPHAEGAPATGQIKWPTPLGMCSILNKKHVFVGVDNLRDVTGRRHPFPVPWQNLWVLTGIDNPAEADSAPESLQKSQIHQLWISLSPRIHRVEKGTEQGQFTAGDWNDEKIQWDVIGAALNIGLIEIQGEIKWTIYVRPIPLPHNSINKILEDTRKIVSYLDLHPHSRAPCSIATYGPTRKTVFTQVSYVPREICKSVYCSVDLGYCFKYPFQWFHVCFRAVVFTDPCKYDQGAALYCNWWSQSVFALLSQSDNCGIDGLPAVYTVMAAPLKLWSAVKNDFADIIDHSPFGRDDDFNKYTLAPDDERDDSSHSNEYDLHIIVRDETVERHLYHQMRSSWDSTRIWGHPNDDPRRNSDTASINDFCNQSKEALLGTTRRNVQYTIGRCSCQQNRLKFLSRKAELLSTYSRLTLPENNNCLNRMLTPISPSQHKARAILEEIMRIEIILETLEHCKNVFSCMHFCQCPCDTQAKIQSKRSRSQSTNRCYDIEGVSRDCNASGKLPEFLLSPMRKYPLDSQKVPQLPDICAFECCHEPNEPSSSSRLRDCCQFHNKMDYQNYQSQYSKYTSPTWFGQDRTYVSMCGTSDNDRAKCLSKPRFSGSKPCSTCSHVCCCGQQSWTQTATTPYKNNEDRTNENCVMVHGFHPQSIQTINQIFSTVGGVSRKCLSRNSNWAIFCYILENDASQACRYDLCRIDGSIIGVTRCISSSLDSFDKCHPYLEPRPGDPDIALIRARQKLALNNGKIEEISGKRKRQMAPKIDLCSQSKFSSFGPIDYRPTSPCTAQHPKMRFGGERSTLQKIKICKKLMYLAIVLLFMWIFSSMSAKEANKENLENSVTWGDSGENSEQVTDRPPGIY